MKREFTVNFDGVDVDYDGLECDWFDSHHLLDHYVSDG
jgi:hypothetical protein